MPRRRPFIRHHGFVLPENPRRSEVKDWLRELTEHTKATEHDPHYTAAKILAGVEVVRRYLKFRPLTQPKPKE